MLTNEFVIYCCFTLIVNAFLAVPLINFLYNHRFYKTKETGNVDTSRRNNLWYDHLGNTLNTPSSFGVLLVVSMLLFGISSFIYEYSNSFTILLVAFLILLLSGLWDDCEKYFLYLKNKRWGLRIRHKLALQFFAVGLYVFFTYGASYLTPFILLALVFVLNAYNITDGLDGLIGGISIPAFLAFSVIEYVTFGFTGFSLLYATILGFLVVFHYFNIKPARVWLGDAGALPLGLIFGICFLRYPFYVTLPISFLIIFEGFSSALQLLAIGLFKKKVFVIAPFHLLLLNKGWVDTKIVQRAQLIQHILCIGALLIFLLFR